MAKFEIVGMEVNHSRADMEHGDIATVPGSGPAHMLAVRDYWMLARMSPHKDTLVQSYG